MYVKYVVVYGSRGGSMRIYAAICDSHAPHDNDHHWLLQEAFRSQVKNVKLLCGLRTTSPFCLFRQSCLATLVWPAVFLTPFESLLACEVDLSTFAGNNPHCSEQSFAVGVWFRRATWNKGHSVTRNKISSLSKSMVRSKWSGKYAPL